MHVLHNWFGPVTPEKTGINYKNALLFRNKYNFLLEFVFFVVIVIVMKLIIFI